GTSTSCRQHIISPAFHRSATHRALPSSKNISSSKCFATPRGGYVKKISLHGHPLHSWENLRFLHSFKLPLPLIPAVLRVAGWQHRRATGRDLALARVLWTPPLAPDEAYRLEARQIANLGLQPIVSLTDHDDIESGLALRRTPVAPAAPVSFEWTVPFGRTFFHL